MVAAGCERVFAETLSSRAARRPELESALQWVREGDTLMVCRLDRLARSVVDLNRIMDALKTKGVALQCLHPPLLAGTAVGGAGDRLFLQMMGVFAEFELDIRKERQAEGIARAKAAGRYKGRPATVDYDEIRRRLATGERPVDVARGMRVGIRTVHRAKESTNAES